MSQRWAIGYPQPNPVANQWVRHFLGSFFLLATYFSQNSAKPIFENKLSKTRAGTSDKKADYTESGFERRMERIKQGFLKQVSPSSTVAAKMNFFDYFFGGFVALGFVRSGGVWVCG